MPDDAASAAPDLSFFDGFAWAVPTAFAAALAGFRFEQGDVLHEARAAYDEAGAGGSGRALQILSPPRSARAAAAEGEGDRRQSSFESEVELTLIDGASGDPRALTTTQGRLLMTLWRGETAWIEGEGEAPPVPLGARSLAGALESGRERFVAALSEGGRVPDAGVLFLFVVDLASDASRVKAAAIREAFAFADDGTWLDCTPAALALDAAEAYHPALVVRGVALAGVDETRATDALRGALYGGKGAVSADEGADPEGDEAAKPTDRFSVARHGLLVTLRE